MCESLNSLMVVIGLYTCAEIAPKIITQKGQCYTDPSSWRKKKGKSRYMWRRLL